VITYQFIKTMQTFSHWKRDKSKSLAVSLNCHSWLIN